MEELIKELEELRRQFNLEERALLHKIGNHNDGFIYKTDTWVHGSSYRDEFPNFFAAKEHIDYFNGDNGVVDLTTNNKKFAEKMETHEGITSVEIIE